MDYSPSSRVLFAFSAHGNGYDGVDGVAGFGGFISCLLLAVVTRTSYSSPSSSL